MLIQFVVTSQKTDRDSWLDAICIQGKGCQLHLAYLESGLGVALGHQNVISVVPHFRPNGFLTYLLRSGYHQSVAPPPMEKSGSNLFWLEWSRFIYSSTIWTRVSLSRVHTPAKAVDVAELLLLNGDTLTA